MNCGHMIYFNLHCWCRTCKQTDTLDSNLLLKCCCLFIFLQISRIKSNFQETWAENQSVMSVVSSSVFGKHSWWGTFNEFVVWHEAELMFLVSNRRVRLLLNIQVKVKHLMHFPHFCQNYLFISWFKCLTCYTSCTMNAADDVLSKILFCSSLFFYNNDSKNKSSIFKTRKQKVWYNLSFSTRRADLG